MAEIFSPLSDVTYRITVEVAIFGLNNHRLRPVGLKYGLKSWYASPKRCVLIWFHLKIIVLSWFKVSLQILFDHFFRYMTYLGTKTASCRKVPAPVSLFQVRIFFEKLARCPPFDSPHNFTQCHPRRTTDQNMYMILAHYTAYYPNLKSFTSFPNQRSHSICNLTRQHLVSIFCYSKKVIIYLKNCMASVPVVHVRLRSKSVLSQLKLTGFSRWF